METWRRLQARRADLAAALELAADPDFKDSAQEEISGGRRDIARLEEELKLLLLPRDPNDEKNVILEVRAGTGGEEAALFARDLVRMYTMYAERRGWRVKRPAAAKRSWAASRKRPCSSRGRGPGPA